MTITPPRSVTSNLQPSLSFIMESFGKPLGSPIMQAGRARLELASLVLETNVLAAELPTHKRKSAGVCVTPALCGQYKRYSGYGGERLPVAVSSKLAIC